MSNYLYVDNSNVLIEGRRVAAVTRGLAPDIGTAMRENILDPTWSYDFGRLLEFAGGNSAEVGGAFLYGSRPPPRDSLWAAAKHHGFEPIIYDRSRFTGREKKVDTSLVADLVKAAVGQALNVERDTFALVAGDADYVPAVHAVREEGFTIEVFFWEQASRELQDACSEFNSLNPWIEHLRRQP
ncbi:MAG: NYN domain-containing protein [Acidobacteria bacterium]|nr:NYN domain-containing protein [Acidobacteriota bacterium]